MTPGLKIRKQTAGPAKEISNFGHNYVVERFCSCCIYTAELFEMIATTATLVRRRHAAVYTSVLQPHLRLCQLNASLAVLSALTRGREAID